MLDFPLEDLLFLGCALVGGGLLLVALKVGDRVNLLSRFDIAGVALVPLLLAFVCAFGIGGLFATHIPDAHGLQAFVAAAGAGVVGLGVTFAVYGRRRRAED
jgi:hypothetical protein